MQYKIISLKDNPYTGKPATFVANCFSRGRNYQIYKDTSGIAFVSPQPTHTELNSFYSNEYFTNQGSRQRSQNQAETIKTSIYFKPEGLLLDIGAGNGYFLKVMKELGIKVLGIEPAKDAVANAWSDGLTQGEIIVGSIKDVPNNNYQYISLMDVLEHLLPEDLDSMLNNLFELMNEKTTLYMKTFFNDDEFTHIIGEEAYWQDHFWEHLFVPSAKGFAEVLLQHGLEIKEILKQEKSGPIVSIKKITGDPKEAEKRVNSVVANHYASIINNQ
jgi:SAM-dependent methyltransferase